MFKYIRTSNRVYINVDDIVKFYVDEELISFSPEFHDPARSMFNIVAELRNGDDVLIYRNYLSESDAHLLLDEFLVRNYKCKDFYQKKIMTEAENKREWEERWEREEAEEE